MQAAGRWPSSTWMERSMLSVVRAPIEAGLWEKASWTGRWSLCPWHGAQFNVTTGQVVGPPAGQSVPAYTVIVEGEDIKVDVSEGAT